MCVLDWISTLLVVTVYEMVVKQPKDKINEHMENTCKKKVNRYYLIFYSGIRKWAWLLIQMEK